ncbi:MAG: glycosyltransferase family 39 protein [Pseudomonadota bacterium]
MDGLGISLEKVTRRRGFDPILPVILIVAVFLLFFQLDQRPFWQDEAETACLAKNVLKYGLPYAFDGKNLISQEEGREFADGDYLWRWSPWLQIYLHAASYYIFGPTTFAGRFPFALSGLLTILMTYVLIRRRFDDVAWARASASLLTLWVPFLLYARQGRYYAVGALLTVLSLYAFRGKWGSRVGPALLLVFSLALLFYANYLLFLSFCAAIFLAALILYFRELRPARTMILGALTAALAVPGVLVSRMGQQTGMMDLGKFSDGLESYLTDVGVFMLPLPLALYLALRWGSAPFRGRLDRRDPGERFVLFLVVILAINILVLALVPQVFNRYLAHLYPVAAMICGWVAVKAWRFQKATGALLFVLLGFTNYLHVLPMDWLGWVNRPWHTAFNMLNYPDIPLRLHLTETTSDLGDVNRCAIDFFRENAGRDDVVFANYGDLPLMFYTDLQVLGGLQGRVPPDDHPPDWVLKRPFLTLSRERFFMRADEYLYNKLDLEQDYEPIVLACPAEMWGARADPYAHRFLPVQEPFRRLTVYRKIKREGGK